MLNVRLVPVALAMSLFAAPAFSQEKAKCASHHAEHELIENNPGLAATIAANEAQLKEDIAEYLTKQKRDNPEYIIPVVFHVLYDFGPELLADEQIHDAMRILNEDFNAENTDLDDVVPSFQNIIGDAKIEFRLAQIDPDGNPTNGIDKISTQETYVGDDGSKLNPWPRDKYLNIWTAREIAVSNAAAYAYRPAAVSTSGQASIDGIISDYTYIGSFGSGSQGSSSRTLTH